MDDNEQLPAPTFNTGSNGGGLLASLFPSEGQGFGGTSFGLGDVGLLAAGGAMGGGTGMAAMMALRFLPQILKMMQSKTNPLKGEAAPAGIQSTSNNAPDNYNPMPDPSKMTADNTQRLLQMMGGSGIKPSPSPDYKPSFTENMLGTSAIPSQGAAPPRPVAPVMPTQSQGALGQLTAPYAPSPQARMTSPSALSPYGSQPSALAQFGSLMMPQAAIPASIAGMIYQMMSSQGRK